MGCADLPLESAWGSFSIFLTIAVAALDVVHVAKNQDHVASNCGIVHLVPTSVCLMLLVPILRLISAAM